MKTEHVKIPLTILSLAVTSILLFQNCSKVSVSDVPSDTKSSVASTGTAAESPFVPIAASPPKATSGVILIEASPATVIEGQQSLLTVTFYNVENIKYTCTNRVTKEILSSGIILNSGQQLRVQVDKDLHCEFVGNDSHTSDLVRAIQDLTLDCANRIKNTAQNKCQDFSCQKFIELTSLNELLKIPARDSNGVCYAIKILNQITLSSSSLNKTIDQDVLSRNHDQLDQSQKPNHQPYQLGFVKTEFRVEGPRVVKLSGGLSDTAPILVDNFLLLGVYPTGADISGNLNSVYSARGTSDSAVLDNNKRSTANIEFLNTPIPVIPYGTGGTGSVSAVDITRSAEPKIFNTLDIRALDCGGSRELSDVYLLFQ